MQNDALKHRVGLKGESGNMAIKELRYVFIMHYYADTYFRQIYENIIHLLL